jgi:hypothetical protein
MVSGANGAITILVGRGKVVLVKTHAGNSSVLACRMSFSEKIVLTVLAIAWERISSWLMRRYSGFFRTSFFPTRVAQDVLYSEDGSLRKSTLILSRGLLCTFLILMWMGSFDHTASDAASPASTGMTQPAGIGSERPMASGGPERSSSTEGDPLQKIAQIVLDPVVITVACAAVFIATVFVDRIRKHSRAKRQQGSG